MPTLRSFKDDGSACFANIRMDNNDPVYISVAQTGVIVKKSKLGMFGPKLFTSNDVFHAAMTGKALSYLFPEDKTEGRLQNPVLKAFVNAALHSTSLANLTAVMNSAISKAEQQSGQSIAELDA